MNSFHNEIVVHNNYTLIMLHEFDVEIYSFEIMNINVALLKIYKM